MQIANEVVEVRNASSQAFRALQVLLGQRSYPVRNERLLLIPSAWTAVKMTSLFALSNAPEPGNAL